tara:strand:- start:906 stop:2255 length:1350 start_codon:yes stop_codon:yes gene_type:complete
MTVEEGAKKIDDLVKEHEEEIRKPFDKMQRSGYKIKKTKGYKSGGVIEEAEAGEESSGRDLDTQLAELMGEYGPIPMRYQRDGLKDVEEEEEEEGISLANRDVATQMAELEGRVSGVSKGASKLTGIPEGEALVAEMLPGVGTTMDIEHLSESIDEGDVWDIGVNSIILAAGLIPGMGPAKPIIRKGARKLKAAIKNNDGLAQEVSKVVDEVGETKQFIAPVESLDIPQNTVKAYKLFRIKLGSNQLYPLFVRANEGVPTGKWIAAQAGELTKTGKVKSGIGPLANRPGWHAGDYVSATHIGGKSAKGLKKVDYRKADEVWAEVEMPNDFDWQSVANSKASIVKSGPRQGQLVSRQAQITDQIPKGGFYRYKTNPTMEGNWMIGGSMKINRVLDTREIKSIQKTTKIYDLPTLPEVINQKGLTLNDLSKKAIEELKRFYPEKLEELIRK